MNLAALDLVSSSHDREAASPSDPRLSSLMLARLFAAPEGLSEGDLVRDLHAFVSHRLAPDAWRRVAAASVASLRAQGHVAGAAGRLEVSRSGSGIAADFLGARKTAGLSWPHVRDTHLPAVALGLKRAPAARLKALAKLDGLRCLIVLGAFNLHVRGAPTPSRLRSALALVALERAFGNQIKHGLGQKPGLSAKSGRLLAGQLSSKPRDFGTDARLIAALAGEAVGAQRSELGALRLAVVRRFVLPPEPPAPEAKAKTVKSRRAARPRAEVHAPSTPASDRHSQVRQRAMPVRPDPAGFARDVIALARTRAEGWAGNRKAFISRVWTGVREARPEWALSEIEFKCMLTQAHRSGLLALASADLKDKRSLDELQASAVSYKNTVWHFIRVED